MFPSVKSSSWSAKEIKQRLLALTPEILRDLYITQEMSMGEIAKKYRTSRITIMRKLKKFGIPTRDKSEARVLALEKKKIVLPNGIVMQKHYWDRDFFTKWTPEMAWVLGVIYTDGCLCDLDCGCLSVSQKYPELLLKILALMGCNAPIHKNTHGKDKKGKQLYIHRFQTGNRELFEQMITFGVMPRKSLILQFPEMPQDCVRHFIRGCWDGDGSVYWRTPKGRKTPIIVASFVSGSYDFIESIRDELRKVGLFKDLDRSYIHPGGRDKNAYNIRVSGRYQCWMLFRYFYEGVPKSQYLLRKYLKFRNFYNIGQMKWI